mgnify:CR=1 FL=1
MRELGLPEWLRWVHLALVGLLLFQMAYAAWQIFVVLQPPGTFGPMFGRAVDLPPEVMLARRLYAIEAWLALLGLALYLAVTEILPRRLALALRAGPPPSC